LKCKFFLLDIGEDYTQVLPTVRIWGIDDSSDRIAIVAQQIKPYFFVVPKDQDDLASSALDQIRKALPNALDITTQTKKLLGQQVQALKVTCSSSTQMVESGRITRKMNIGEVFEDDIRLPVKYMMDFHLAPCAWQECDVSPFKIHNVQADATYQADSEIRASRQEKQTKLRMLAFSLLVVGQKGSARAIKDPIRAVAVATDGGKSKSIAAEKDDRELIKWFVQEVKSNDPDVIVGFNSNRLAWPYFMERSKQNQIKLTLGRDSSEPHTSLYGHTSIAGRANLDLADFATGITELKVKSLERLASYFKVGRGVQAESIDDLQSSALWSEESGRIRLKHNNEAQSKVSLELGKLTLTYASQLSTITGLPLDQVMSAAVGFRVDSYLIRRANSLGELIPSQKEQPFYPYRGAIVFEPKPGIHESVVVLDFASMYPNLMRKYNLSPDTLIRQGEDYKIDQIFVIPEVNHKFRKSPDGLYRLALSDLIEERAVIKRELAKPSIADSRFRELTEREKAVKVVTNACYGYAGWLGARWYAREVAESATALGRDTITRTVTKAKEVGLHVIYGDTDSIFVENDEDKVNKLLAWVNETLELEIRPERQYSRILFTEAMKRYAGLLQDGSLDVVGLEVVRGDWSEIAKQVQEEVLVSVLRDRSTEEAVKKVILTVRKLREGRVPILDLTIRKSLAKSVQEYSVRTPHVEVAKKLIKEGWELGAGDQVAYVIIKGPGKLYQKAESFTGVTAKQVDVDYYIQNQIKPAAMRILGGLGVSEKQLDA